MTPHFRRMPQAMKMDETFDPAGIGLLRAKAIVQRAYARTHLLHQTGFGLSAAFAEFLRHALLHQHIKKQGVMVTLPSYTAHTNNSASNVMLMIELLHEMQTKFRWQKH